MMKVNMAWLVVPAVVLVMVAPTQALAGECASGDFVAATAGDDGDVNFGVVSSLPGGCRFPDVHTKRHDNPVAVSPGMTAADLANASINAICEEAVDIGYTCTGGPVCNPLAMPGNYDCCDDPEGLRNVECHSPTCGPLGGFTLSHGAGSDRFVVCPIQGTRLNALTSSNRSLVKIDTDLLPRFCLRVDRGNPAVDGNVNFSVRYFEGGDPTSTFTVSTAGKSDTQLHDDIVTGFNGLGLDLELATMDGPGGKCLLEEAFNGPLVSIWNVTGRGVLEIGMDSEDSDPNRNMNLVAETNAPITAGDEAQIPTLSEWGLILLVAALSLSALWMLRRRRETRNSAA